MGTQLGNVTKNYGRQHNVTVTNLNGETILASENLLANTTIISAPTSVSKEDIGTYAIFETDAEGNAVRLSYTIQPGNGLVVGRNGETETSGDGLDVISMAIDDWSIQEYKTAPDKGTINQGLFVNKENIIDNYTLQVVTPTDDVERIKVITENLDHATTLSYGIAKGDEKTIRTDNGLLIVNTYNLDYVDDTNSVNGIVSANSDLSRTIIANNGSLSVWTENLDPAEEDKLGVIKPDMSYTFVDADGTLRVKDFAHAYAYVSEALAWHEELDSYVSYYVTQMQYGIVVPDLTTTYTPEEGTLSVRTEGLTPATTDKAGVVKVDGVSTIMSETGVLSVAYWGKIQHMLNEFDERWTNILAKLADLEGRVATLETIASAEHIILDVDSEMLSTLQLPVWDEEQGIVVSPVEDISVEVRVSTNCPFKISIEYADNINPPIVLTKIKYGSDQIVTAAGLIDKIFDSTDDTINQLKLSFECSNYTSETDESITQTVATIKVTSINDAAVCKKAVHTFVRHNCAKYVKVEPVTTVKPITTDAPIGWTFSYITELSSNMSNKIVTSYYNAQATFNYPIYMTGMYHNSYYNSYGSKVGYDSKGYMKPVFNSAYANKNNTTISATGEDGKPVTWLRYSLASSYVSNDNHMNYIKVTTDKAISTRTAYIKLEYNKDTTYSSTLQFTQRVPDQQPQIKLVSSNKVVSGKNKYQYTVSATRDTVSALKNPANGWNVIVGVKDITVNGQYIYGSSAATRWVKLSGTKDEYTVSETISLLDVEGSAIAAKISEAYTTAGTFTYSGQPAFTYYTRGVWDHNLTGVSNLYKIGDAKISKVEITNWDDVGMTISFSITPGENTVLPKGCYLLNGGSTFNSTTGTTFKFVKNNVTYDASKFFDVYSVSGTPWTNAGCTVSIRLYNEIHDDTLPVRTYSAWSSINDAPFYLHTGPFSHEYDSDLTRDGYYPMLKSFNFLRFWFELYLTAADGTLMGQKFTVNNTETTYKLGDAKTDIVCNQGATYTVSIVNGEYNQTSTSTSTQN